MKSIDPIVQARVVESVGASRRTLDRVMDRQGLHPVRKAYEDEVLRIQRRLHREARARASEEYTAPVRNGFLRFIARSTVDLTSKVGDVLSDTVHSTLQEGMHSIRGFLYRVRGKPSPVDETVTENRIIRLYAPTILSSRASAVRSLSEAIHGSVSMAARLRATKPTVADVVAEIEDSFDAQWWRVERTVKTETSRAYNAVQSEALMEVGKQEPGLWARWTERVDDFSGKPLDGRVGKDSIAMHGQVARPGKMFTMPDDSSVDVHFIGQSWAYPPNRPHDRAVIIPWMPEWGIKSWMYRDGGRSQM